MITNTTQNTNRNDETKENVTTTITINKENKRKQNTTETT